MVHNNQHNKIPVELDCRLNPLKVLWIPILFLHNEYLEWLLQNLTDNDTRIRFSGIRKELYVGDRMNNKQLPIPHIRFLETLFLLKKYNVILCWNDIIKRIDLPAERLRYRELFNRKSSRVINDEFGEKREDDRNEYQTYVSRGLYSSRVELAQIISEDDDNEDEND